MYKSIQLNKKDIQRLEQVLEQTESEDNIELISMKLKEEYDMYLCNILSKKQFKNRFVEEYIDKVIFKKPIYWGSFKT